MTCFFKFLSSNQGEPLVEIATQYLTNKVVTALKPMKAEASQELFDLFNNNDSVIKGTTGTLLVLLWLFYARRLVELNFSNG